MMTMEKTSLCELETFAKLLHLRNRKHVPCFYRVIETRGSLGEREMLWEHEPQASVAKASSSSPKLSRVFL